MMLLTECNTSNCKPELDDRSRDTSTADARSLASCRSWHVDHNRCNHLAGLGDSGCGRDLRGNQRNALLGHDAIARRRFATLARRNVLRTVRVGARRHCDDSGAQKAGERSHRAATRSPRAKADASLRKKIGRGSNLPAIVRERFVRFGHPVRVFLLLDCVAFALARSDDFGGQLFGHRLLVAAA